MTAAWVVYALAVGALVAAEQRLVLAHEREHVRARDPLLLALGWAAAALIPWHPAVWWMLARLRLAVELDCDARVLRQGAPRASYGALLIDLAGQGSGFRIGAPALADNAAHLERRLLTMTPHRTRFAPARAAALGAGALLTLLAACEAKLPTEAEVSRMKVSDVVRGARSFAFIRGADSTATYTLDGRTITAAEAHALAPEQIGQIQVMRKRTPNGPEGGAQVNITSRKPGDELRVARAGTLPSTETRIMFRKIGDSASLAHDGPPDVLSGEQFEGVLLIDGVRAEPSRLRTLTPNTIASIEVIKGPTAATMYDAPEAARGVIRITTKK